MVLLNVALPNTNGVREAYMLQVAETRSRKSGGAEERQQQRTGNSKTKPQEIQGRRGEGKTKQRPGNPVAQVRGESKTRNRKSSGAKERQQPNKAAYGRRSVVTGQGSSRK